MKYNFEILLNYLLPSERRSKNISVGDTNIALYDKTLLFSFSKNKLHKVTI